MDTTTIIEHSLTEQNQKGGNNKYVKVAFYNTPYNLLQIQAAAPLNVHTDWPRSPPTLRQISSQVDIYKNAATSTKRLP
jgi:hypothetical protein